MYLDRSYKPCIGSCHFCISTGDEASDQSETRQLFVKKGYRDTETHVFGEMHYDIMKPNQS